MRGMLIRGRGMPLLGVVEEGPYFLQRVTQIEGAVIPRVASRPIIELN